MNFSSFVVLVGFVFGIAFAGNNPVLAEKKSTSNPEVAGQKHIPTPTNKKARPSVQLETYEDLLKQQTPQLDTLPSSGDESPEEEMRAQKEFDRQQKEELRQELELEKKKKRATP
jgi:hypothetical protein